MFRTFLNAAGLDTLSGVSRSAVRGEGDRRGGVRLQPKSRSATCKSDAPLLTNRRRHLGRRGLRYRDLEDPAVAKYSVRRLAAQLQMGPLPGRTEAPPC